MQNHNNRPLFLRKVAGSLVLASFLSFSISGCEGLIPQKKEVDIAEEGETVITGTVNLSGLVSKTTASTKSLHATDDEYCGEGGKVVLYSANDVSYESALTTPIEVEDDCSYDLTSDSFKDADEANKNGDYIVKIVVEANGKNYELAALTTGNGRDDNSGVSVDPITTMVKDKIIASITDLFGSSFTLSAAILSIIDTLASQVTDAVKKEVESGELTLDPTLFDTDESISISATVSKIDAEEAAARAAALGSNGALAGFESSLGSIKQGEVLGDITESDLRQDTLPIDLARVKYQVIQSFVRLGTGVHDGAGKLLAFLPVPREEQSQLPGSQYSISALDGDKSVKVGSDFAVRAIDVSSDLKNMTGRESWAHDIMEPLFYAPKIPNAAIVSVLQNINNEVSFKTMASFLSDENNPVNLFEKVNGITLSTNVNDSVEKLLTPFKNDFFKTEYDRRFFDSFDRAFHNATNGTFDVAKFKSAFEFFTVQNEEDAETALSRMLSEAGGNGELDAIFDQVASTLTSGIPFRGEGNLIRFENGYTIDEDSTITPLAALSFEILYLQGERAGNVNLEAKKLVDVFPIPELKESSELAELQIWFPKYGGEDETEDDKTAASVKLLHSEEGSSEDGGVVDFIDYLVGNTNNDGEVNENRQKIRAESSFKTLVNNIKTIQPTVEEKVFGGNGGGFVDPALLFADASELNASLSFTIFKNQEEPNTDIKTLKLVPVIENSETFEWIPVDALTKEVNVSNGVVAVSGINVINPQTAVDENGDPDESGKYHFNSHFEFVVIEKEDDTNGEGLFIGGFPLFPGENSIGKIFFGGADFVDNGGGGGGHVGPEARFLGMGDQLNYPNIELTESNGHVKRFGETIAEYTNEGVLKEVNRPDLTEAVFTWTLLASSWEEQDSYYTNESNGTEQSGGVDISALKEGALFQLGIKMDNDRGKVDQRILMSLNFKDSAGGVELEMFPHPDDIQDEFFGPIQEVSFPDNADTYTTLLKFNVDGIADTTGVSEISVIPLIVKQGVEHFDVFNHQDKNIVEATSLKTTLTTSTEDEFLKAEGNVTLYNTKTQTLTVGSDTYNYTGFYLFKIKENGEEREFSRFKLNPQEMNDFGFLFAGGFGDFDPFAGEPIETVAVLETDIADKTMIFAGPFVAVKLSFDKPSTGKVTRIDNGAKMEEVADYRIENGAIVLDFTEYDFQDYILVTSDNHADTLVGEDVVFGGKDEEGGFFANSPEHNLTYLGNHDDAPDLPESEHQHYDPDGEPAPLVGDVQEAPNGNYFKLNDKNDRVYTDSEGNPILDDHQGHQFLDDQGNIMQPSGDGVHDPEFDTLTIGGQFNPNDISGKTVIFVNPQEQIKAGFGVDTTVSVEFFDVGTQTSDTSTGSYSINDQGILSIDFGNNDIEHFALIDNTGLQGNKIVFAKEDNGVFVPDSGAMHINYTGDAAGAPTLPIAPPTNP